MKLLVRLSCVVRLSKAMPVVGVVLNDMPFKQTTSIAMGTCIIVMRFALRWRNRKVV